MHTPTPLALGVLVALSAVSRPRRADGMTKSLTIVRRLHIVRVCRLAH